MDILIDSSVWIDFFNFYDVKEALLNFSILDNNIMTVTNNAINIYRNLRKKGITIRKQNDCLIAAYAIYNGIQILHKDSDFEKIASNTKLKTYKTPAG
jgi:predicted nucleic acid-binding protein